jgi:hypothetical protein
MPTHEVVNRWLASGYLVTGIICMASVTVVAWKLYNGFF